MFETRSTIYALSTPYGVSAVAVLRLSGRSAFAVAERLTGKAMGLLPRQAQLCTVREIVSRETIDQALVIPFPAPKSFTGEDLVEFQVHGSRAVIDALLEILGQQPECRLAEAGEFSWRALHNGKLDLLQVEGLANLLEAETEAQRRLALGSVQGGLSGTLLHWRNEIENLQAELEAQIDFPDDGLDSFDLSLWQAKVHEVLRLVDRVLETQKPARWVREGLRVVLLGAPNVGKSTLLNALSKREAAIVTSQPGTTRDAIEVEIRLAGVQVILIDTAGLRANPGPVEAKGIERTQTELQRADLLLWVQDATRQDTWRLPDIQFPSVDLWTLVNKIDKIPPDETGSVSDAILISAQNGDGIVELLALLERHIREQLEPLQSQTILTQARQIEAVSALRQSLRRAIGEESPESREITTEKVDSVQRLSDYPTRSNSIELAAEQIRAALLACDRVLGRNEPERMLDRLFSRFCIGK